MNAIKLLEEDHKKVRKLLDELDKTTERGVKTREQLFTKVKNEVTAHEIVEEEILYPTLQEYAKAREIVLEGYEEHHVVDVIMAEISEVPYDDETWGAKLSVMKENLEHHIEEEEGDMFAKARQFLDEAELEELGTRMERRKREALGQIEEVTS